MKLKEEFSELANSLKTERDAIKVRLHLASMDIKDEFETIDKKWNLVSQKADDIAKGAGEVSDDAIAKVKVVGDEVKDAYHRIRARLSK